MQALDGINPHIPGILPFIARTRNSGRVISWEQPAILQYFIPDGIFIIP
jgi:hypothetical protein